MCQAPEFYRALAMFLIQKMPDLPTAGARKQPQFAVTGFAAQELQHRLRVGAG
jgi:hypothetical protein